MKTRKAFVKLLTEKNSGRGFFRAEVMAASQGSAAMSPPETGCIRKSPAHSVPTDDDDEDSHSGGELLTRRSSKTRAESGSGHS